MSLLSTLCHSVKYNSSVMKTKLLVKIQALWGEPYSKPKLRCQFSKSAVIVHEEAFDDMSTIGMLSVHVVQPGLSLFS